MEVNENQQRLGFIQSGHLDSASRNKGYFLQGTTARSLILFNQLKM